MKRMYRTVSTLAAVGTLLASLGIGSVQAQQAVVVPRKAVNALAQKGVTAPLTTVTVASDNAPAQAGIILADKMGYFQREGIRIAYKTFASGEDELTALSAGQVDVARGVVSAGLFNAIEQGIKVRLVADGGQNQVQKPYFELVLKKSLASKVKTFKDLKNLRIGIASQGTVNELFLAKALAKGGLTLKDVHEVVVDSFPDLNTAVANGAIDGAVQIEPLITEGVQKGYLSWWKNPQTYAPNEPVSIIEYGKRLLDNKQLGDRFMVAYLQGVRAYDNALIFGKVNQKRVINLMAGNTFVTSPKLWLQEKNPLLSPNGYVPTGLASDLKFYVAQGLTQPIALSKVQDMSFVDHALKILGVDHQHS